MQVDSHSAFSAKPIPQVINSQMEESRIQHLVNKTQAVSPQSLSMMRDMIKAQAEMLATLQQGFDNQNHILEQFLMAAAAANPTEEIVAERGRKLLQTSDSAAEAMAAMAATEEPDDDMIVALTECLAEDDGSKLMEPLESKDTCSLKDTC